MRDRLATMPAPGGRADLDAAPSLASDLLLPDRENAVTVITDGALAADPAVAAALGAPIELVDLPGPDANLAVVSVATKPGSMRPCSPTTCSVRRPSDAYPLACCSAR